MKRLQISGPVRARSAASISLFVFAVAGCGGGGSSGDGAPAAGAASDAAVTADVAAAPGGQQAAPAAAGVAAPVAATPAPAVSTNPGAPAALTQPVGATGTAPTPTARDVAFHKLGAAGNVGTARLDGNVLTLDGKQFGDTSLVAGACTVGGGMFSQCASVASQPTFTLCGNNNGSGSADKVRSRYVLFDPNAVRITDAAVLQNRSFDGYENCGQDNVGAQTKGAPSSTLQFDAAGNLTLTRYDRSPARTDTLPASLLNLSGESKNGGNTATFTLYRVNGRHLIVATTAPTSGPTTAEPGTLTAFVER